MASNPIYGRTTIQIIKRVLRTIRVIDAETPIEGIHRSNALEALNGFVKFLQTEGFNLWRETEALLVLAKGQRKYLLGEDGDHCFDEDDFIDTTLSSGAAETESILTLADSAGMKAASDILTSDPTTTVQGWTVTDGTIEASSLGLVLTNTAQGSASYDLTTTVGTTYILICNFEKGNSASANFYIEDIDGTIVSDSSFSDTQIRLEFTARQTTSTFKFENGSSSANVTNSINSLNYIDKSTGDKIGVFLDDDTIQWSNVIYLSPFEIADELIDDAASGNTIYTYTNVVPRPMNINNCRFRNSVTGNDIPTTEWTRSQYQEQPNKRTEGTVTKWYYSPKLGDGVLFIWQPASNNKGLLPITFIRPLDITDDNADEIDFPSEWYDLITYGTANMLLAEYKVPQDVVVKVESKYAELLEQGLGFDNDGFMNVEIDYEGRR